MKRRAMSREAMRMLYALLLLLAFLGSFVSASLAWLSRVTSFSAGEDFSASSIAEYFAGGNGDVNTPYLIADKSHLYNLAWLQYMGIFNQDANGDGYLDKQFHFKMIADVDMSGLIIPPIGTEENPFYGSFLGAGYMISNATVSNYVSSDREGGITLMPPSVSAENFDRTITEGETSKTASIVGFFGVIGHLDGVEGGLLLTDTQKTANGVTNFFLNDLTVRSDTDETLAGLLAGYVNADVSNVGIASSEIRLEAGVAPLALSGLDMLGMVSEFSLIGAYEGENVKWVELPSGAGGGVSDGTGSGTGGGEGDGSGGEGDGNEGGNAIKIYVDTDTSSALGNVEDGPQQIPHSIPDRAFFVDVVASAAISPVPTKFYRYETLISSENGNLTARHALNASRNGAALPIDNAQDFGATGSLDAVNEDIVSLLFNATASDVSLAGSANGIKFGNSSPTIPTVGSKPPSAWPEVTLSGGTKIFLPDNAIWFKPIGGGICDVAFGVGNMGNDYCYKSIYRFLRDDDGKIVEWVETPLVFTKSNFGLDNKTLLFYQYEITDDEAEAGYEYLVANSSRATVGNNFNYSKDSTSFFFLSLAGVDITGGDGEGGGGSGGEAMYAIEGVNFVDTVKLEARSIENYALVVVKAELTAETSAAAILSYARASETSMSATASGTGASAVRLTQVPGNPIPPAESTVASLPMLPNAPPWQRRDERI